MIVRRGPKGSAQSADLGPADGRDWFAAPALIRPSGGDRRRDREYRIRKATGIQPEEYDHLIAAQRGICYACRQSTPRVRGNAGPAFMRSYTVDGSRVLVCRRCDDAIRQLAIAADALSMLASCGVRDA